MGTPLRALIVEDSESDTELLLRQLRQSGFEPVSERVETGDQLRAALAKPGWDIILSDYALPGFNGLQALAVVRSTGLDLPFIIVSGTIGEDVAVGAMKAGAHDYFMKGRLARLGPAVARELGEAEEHRQRQQAEKALRLTKFSVDAASVGAFWLRADASYSYVNEAAGRLLGYSREELLKMTAHDLNSSRPREAWQWYWDEIRRRKSWTYEAMLRAKDGRMVPVEIIANYVEFEGEACNCAFVRDLTERQRAEKRIAAFSDLGRSLSAVITRKQAAKVIMDAADALFGWDACSLVLYLPEHNASVDVLVMDTIGGQRVDVSLDSSDTKLAEFTRKVITDGAQLILRGQPQTAAPRLQSFGDNSRRSASLMFVPVHHGAKVIAVMSIQSYSSNAYDPEALKTLQALADHCGGALERLQAEDRLRRQAALLDAATDAIYIRAMDHTVSYWNQGAERLFGWTLAEALGRKFADLIHEDQAAFEAANAVLLEQGSWSGELKQTGKAGKEHVVFCRWTLLRDEQGRATEVLAINTDITAQKQLEANFLRAQRQESIGALAGGIAHDLNNILAPILMSASLLRETVADPESRRMLSTMESCAQRGADIIKQLLTFARGKPGARVPLPAQHLLREMEKIIRETFPRNIQPRVNTPKDLWPVLGDATQIHQALMNLCVNARDAMPDGGRLTLAAENRTLDAALAALTPDAKPGTYVCVTVTDAGEGIPPEILDRVFDPFFTTKEIGKGTGLGLATVLGIVRGHGGFVWVNSRVGHGTTFELFLPASPAAQVAPPTARATPPPRGAGELVLVVDDEAAVRGIAQRALQQHGYEVVTAAEGAEALALFARRRAEVKAVITDMMMPGMDGPALVLSLRRLEPHLPILGMTGLAERAGVKGLETLDLAVVLTKPFAVVELLDALNRALAPAGEPPAS